MKARQIFPLGKAYGKAFCNRIEETKKLISNIENGEHTFYLHLGDTANQAYANMLLNN